MNKSPDVSYTLTILPPQRGHSLIHKLFEYRYDYINKRYNVTEEDYAETTETYPTGNPHLISIPKTTIKPEVCIYTRTLQRGYVKQSKVDGIKYSTSKDNNGIAVHRYKIDHKLLEELSMEYHGDGSLILEHIDNILPVANLYFLKYNKKDDSYYIYCIMDKYMIVNDHGYDHIGEVIRDYVERNSASVDQPVHWGKDFEEFDNIINLNKKNAGNKTIMTVVKKRNGDIYGVKDGDLIKDFKYPKIGDSVKQLEELNEKIKTFNPKDDDEYDITYIDKSGPTEIQFDYKHTDELNGYKVNRSFRTNNDILITVNTPMVIKAMQKEFKLLFENPDNRYELSKDNTTARYTIKKNPDIFIETQLKHYGDKNLYTVLKDKEGYLQVYIIGTKDLEIINNGYDHVIKILNQMESIETILKYSTAMADIKNQHNDIQQKQNKTIIPLININDVNLFPDHTNILFKYPNTPIILEQIRNGSNVKDLIPMIGSFQRITITINNKELDIMVHKAKNIEDFKDIGRYLRYADIRREDIESVIYTISLEYTDKELRIMLEKEGYHDKLLFPSALPNVKMLLGYNEEKENIVNTDKETNDIKDDNEDTEHIIVYTYNGVSFGIPVSKSINEFKDVGIFLKENMNIKLEDIDNIICDILDKYTDDELFKIYDGDNIINTKEIKEIITLKTYEGYTRNKILDNIDTKDIEYYDFTDRNNPSGYYVVKNDEDNWVVKRVINDNPDNDVISESGSCILTILDITIINKIGHRYYKTHGLCGYDNIMYLDTGRIVMENIRDIEKFKDLKDLNGWMKYITKFTHIKWGNEAMHDRFYVEAYNPETNNSILIYSDN